MSSDWNLRPGQVVIPPPPTKKRKVWPWVLGGGLAFAAVLVLCMALTFSDATRQPVVNTPQETPFPTGQAVGGNPQTIDDGQWLVGKDVAAGTYRTAGAADTAFPACGWAVRKSDAQNAEVIDAGGSNKVNAPGRVVLKKGQVLETSGCKPWVKQ